MNFEVEIRVAVMRELANYWMLILKQIKVYYIIYNTVACRFMHSELLFFRPPEAYNRIVNDFSHII